MSIDLTVFAAYTLSSGLAINEPATKATATIANHFEVAITDLVIERSYKTR
jgi:hypothetical protein